MSASISRTAPSGERAARHRFFGACACCRQAASPLLPARRNFLAGGIAALGLGAAAVAARPTTIMAAQPAATTEPERNERRDNISFDVMSGEV